MSILSIFVLSVLTISIFAIGFTLTYAMISNFNKGKAVRQNLMTKINQLRYGKILTFLDINKNALLHKVSLVEIENEIRTCQSCKQTSECDKTLGKSNCYKGKVITFCPNAASIQAHQVA